MSAEIIEFKKKRMKTESVMCLYVTVVAEYDLETGNVRAHCPLLNMHAVGNSETTARALLSNEITQADIENVKNFKVVV